MVVAIDLQQRLDRHSRQPSGCLASVMDWSERSIVNWLETCVRTGRSRKSPHGQRKWARDEGGRVLTCSLSCPKWYARKSWVGLPLSPPRSDSKSVNGVTAAVAVSF